MVVSQLLTPTIDPLETGYHMLMVVVPEANDSAAIEGVKTEGEALGLEVELAAMLVAASAPPAMVARRTSSLAGMLILSRNWMEGNVCNSG